MLRLQRIPGIGPAIGRKLIDHFGSANAIFELPGRELFKIKGIGRILGANLLNGKYLREAEAEFSRLQEQKIACLSYRDKKYPALLKECQDGPLLLFQKGRFEIAGERLISIVGTRNMTEYGRRFTEQLVEELLPYRPVIVSGLAYGVDICAQGAAIRRGLQTVACLAHGLDTVYPHAHKRYLREICSNGGVLSEFWLGTRPEPMHFIRRNRIIAGISEATVVVESASRGGSLATADLAFGYHREVFAVPGRAEDYFSQGCNEMIRKQKAQLLQSAGQLAQELNWTADAGSNDATEMKSLRDSLNPEQRQILEYLDARNAPLLDDIANHCKCAVGEAASVLLRMEMDGIVEALPGKRFRIRYRSNRPGSRYPRESWF